jgi:hypothetical protein
MPAMTVLLCSNGEAEMRDKAIQDARERGFEV